MKPRTTLVLAVLAVVVIGAAWYFGARTTPAVIASESAAGRPAFPDAAARLQNAAVLELSHQGNKIVLNRKGDVWGVAQDSGYPADTGKVHDLLAGLAGLKLMEPRTADPAEYSRLGVADPGLNADSTLVRVNDAAGKPIIALIVGHSRTSGMSGLPDQLYVRRPGAAQSWLAEGRLPMEDDALMWLDRIIINIGHAQIARVVSARPGQKQIELVADRGKLEMKQPAQHPPLDPAKLSDVAGSLELLSFLRVQPGTTLPGKELGHSRFTTTDGMTVDVAVNQKANEIWARFVAGGQGKAKAQSTKLEARLGNWIYELGGWKEKTLVPAMDDLAAPPPPSVAKTSAPGAMLSPMRIPDPAVLPPAIPAELSRRVAPAAGATAKPESGKGWPFLTPAPSAK